MNKLSLGLTGYESDTEYLSPELQGVNVLDLMCSHFVLTLVTKHSGRFNVRRDLNGLLGLTGRHLVWPTAILESVRKFLNARCVDNDLWRGHELLSHRIFLERFCLWRGAYDEGTLFYYLDEYVKDHPKEILTLLSHTKDWIAKHLKRNASLVEKNINALAGILNLNSAERALLLWGTLARQQRELYTILTEFKVSNAQEAYALMGELTGVSPADLAEALRVGSRIERIGLVDNLIAESNITDLADLFKVSDKLPPVLSREYEDEVALMSVFTKPAAKSALALSDFEFVQEETRILQQLLSHAVQKQQEGVNILVYGPPGTGKTELARVVAQAAGLALYEVEYADREGNALGGKDRYRSLQIAQVFLKDTEGAALLFDEVEDVFPPISSEAAQILARAEQGGHASVNGKAWVNQILESNPVPTIWVTNRIEQIDPAFLRRFAYHLELASPPPGARATLVRKALQDIPDWKASEEFVARLAERKTLTPAQVRTATRFALLVAGGDVRQNTQGEAALDWEALIERQLQHADAALGNKPAKGGRSHATHYDLGMLNVESRFDIARIVQALQARGHGTLCFYGPPGTGKTALAEHIAQSLGQPLMIRQASDLMSKYVGETEQNMAKMFQDAQNESAVLLLDEADTFLQDRRGAQRQYEVSEVNEMLQGMERYKGIFICTTNLFDQIDQAALRRFSFKIAFKPLTQTQREAMFTAEALDGQTHALNAPLQQRLEKLTHLCPGDFAAVRKQIEILACEMSPEEFMDQLEAEHRLKPEVREARSIGFTA